MLELDDEGSPSILVKEVYFEKRMNRQPVS
jgi:hypothetical protein